MLAGREEGQSKERASADFLPVNPVASPFDERATQSPSADHNGVHTESLEQWVARKTMEFNIMTRAQPNCEDAWLRFADFQEELVLALHGGGKEQSSIEVGIASFFRMRLDTYSTVRIRPIAN